MVPMQIIENLVNSRLYKSAEECLNFNIPFLKTGTELIQVYNLQGKVYHDTKQWKKCLDIITELEKLEVDWVLEPDFRMIKAKCNFELCNVNEAIEVLLPVYESELAKFKDGKRNRLFDICFDLNVYYGTIGEDSKATEMLLHIPKDYKDFDIVKYDSVTPKLVNGDFLEAFKMLYDVTKTDKWGTMNKYNIDKSKYLPNVESIRDKIIVAFNEGGIGDEVIFARFIQVIKKYEPSKIIVVTDRLTKLMSRVVGVDEVVSTKAIESGGVKYDYIIPMMSAPAFLNVNTPVVDDLQYIKDDEKQIQSLLLYNSTMNSIKKYHNQEKNKLNIAVRWMGNPGFPHDHLRQLPAKELESLTYLGSVFSVQKIDKDYTGDNKLDTTSRIIDMDSFLNTWNDTISIMRNCDYVVTSCTSVAHIAAVTGCKVIVIVPKMSYMVWVPDCYENSKADKWYGSNVKVIHQKEFGNWSTPIKEAYDYILENTKK